MSAVEADLTTNRSHVVLVRVILGIPVANDLSCPLLWLGNGGLCVLDRLRGLYQVPCSLCTQFWVVC